MDIDFPHQHRMTPAMLKAGLTVLTGVKPRVVSRVVLRADAAEFCCIAGWTWITDRHITTLYTLKDNTIINTFDHELISVITTWRETMTHDEIKKQTRFGKIVVWIVIVAAAILLHYIGQR